MISLTKILYDTILSATPIILCVLGGMYAHKANVLNIALEGMMLMGAFFTCFFTMTTGSYLWGVVLATGITLLVGLIFGFFSITCKGNVIIVGLAINLFASAMTAFILQVMGKADLVADNHIISNLRIHIPLIQSTPILKAFSGHTPLTYFSYFSIAIMWVIMFKTKFGIYVRVVGENEDAAKSVGIPSKTIKYIAVFIGAVFAALAGASMAMDDLGGIFTKDMIAGRGFIAIAAIFCGRGMPIRSVLYAVAFGLTRSLALNLSIYAGSSSRLFNSLPYVIIVLVLLFSSIIKYRKNQVRGFHHE